ncbi:YqaE/Pmp3 family membrane protein [Catenovulum maritimum]|uniref:Hemolysin BL lytic component L2 n=1 Tax=Catenovulum maritimum TaxID=1513271 RepID=A0A0J8JMJ3_9ALTE|nr:YqaE/Pmp3 family membrane protein [Catenovulum maritimum]KMT65831.1 hypothetical protein XM47_07490 [Catenovulum maritimum]
MMYLLAILLPPIAVLIAGRPMLALLNLVLCFCLYIPGVVHAIFVVHTSKADKRNKAVIDAIKNKD